MNEINNIFVEVPNRETYEEYKSDINPDSLVFIKDEDKLIGNDTEYQFASVEGYITLIDEDDNIVEALPLLKKKLSDYGYYSDTYHMVGDWDTPIVI